MPNPIIRKYTSLEALQKEAAKVGKTVNETDICFSFYIYENRQAKYFHVYYK